MPIHSAQIGNCSRSIRSPERKIEGIITKVGDGEKAKAIIKEGDANVEKAKAVAKGEDPVEEDSDSKDEEAPEKGDTEDVPDKEGDDAEGSELEDF